MKLSPCLMFSFLAIAALSAWPIDAQSQPETGTDPLKPVPSDWPSPIDDNRVLSRVIFDQLEGRTSGKDTAFRWDGQGWVGNDRNKLWIKSEGTVSRGRVGDGDTEALYDRPIPRLRYFDWQAGVRVDLDSGPRRTWGAVGIEGLAPYYFDFEPTLYFRDGGHIAARVAGSYNMLITQRLILQPQLEMNFYNKDDPARGLGSGFSDLDSGLRLRYEFSRKFAPYVGFTYSGKFGNTAEYARRAGEPVHAPRVVFGIRIWR
jgi:copper resistance protein B